MADQPEKGLMRWVTTTNHKDIGTLYLIFSLVMFFTAGLMALIMRTELSSPYLMIISPLVYNQLVTAHGLIMIFGAIMPALAGFANWQIPLMIGAADMAFPRLNNWSFWLLPFAMIMLMSPYFLIIGSMVSDPKNKLSILPLAYNSFSVKICPLSKSLQS